MHNASRQSTPCSLHCSCSAARLRGEEFRALGVEDQARYFLFADCILYQIINFQSPFAARNSFRPTDRLRRQHGLLWEAIKGMFGVQVKEDSSTFIPSCPHIVILLLLAMNTVQLATETKSSHRHNPNLTSLTCLSVTGQRRHAANAYGQSVIVPAIEINWILCSGMRYAHTFWSCLVHPRWQNESSNI